MQQRLVIRLGGVLAVLAMGIGLAVPCRGGDTHNYSFHLQAGDSFELGQGAWSVRLAEKGGVCLYDRVLVEDDGPGIGSDADWLKTDRAPTLELSGSVRIKKVLHIERLGALEARLSRPAEAVIELNGHPLPITGDGPWVEVPLARLKLGDNEIVLSCPAGKRTQVKMATAEDILRNAPERNERPRRSFKSIDGGKTWEPVAGEYMVRLHLVQYVPQGSLVSEVLDAAPSTGERAPLLDVASLRSVSLASNAEIPAGTRIELAFRTGRTPVYEASSWSSWQSAGPVLQRSDRYWQWKATLFSTDPLKTPTFKSVIVETKVTRPPEPAWAKAVRVGAFHNEEIRYTSLPFEYEDPRHPKLVALRNKYKLDEVVAGAATETERLVRLRDWVSRQWKFKVPETDFPAWDADEILTRKCGFCVQYAIVLMQSAISLGYQARFVFGYNPGAFDGGGHEVCEIWSNEHRKWLFFDVNQNWHYIDARTRVPLSMLEMHELLARTYYGDKLASLAPLPTRREPSDAIALCFGTNMTPGIPPKNFEIPYTDGRCTVPTRWLYVNYMPRNNFFAKPYPQPKTQGAHWDWSDYWCWEDRVTPKRWLYRNFTARRSDLNWTINQVRYDATLMERPGTVSLQLGTVTPYFETFLVKLDEAPWKESSKVVEWHLHPGHNRVEMRVRNVAKVEGPVSFLELDYRP